MIRMSFDGAPQFAKAMDALEAKVRGQVVHEVAKAGAGPMVAAVKALVPSETGTLKKSIGQKQKRYRGGRISTVIIGARTGFAREITRTVTKRGKLRIKSKRTKEKATQSREVRDPSRYLHLPDTGRKAVRAKGSLMPIRTGGAKTIFVRGAREVKGTHFMARAFQQAWPLSRNLMLAKARALLESAMKSAA